MEPRQHAVQPTTGRRAERNGDEPADGRGLPRTAAWAAVGVPATLLTTGCGAASGGTTAVLGTATAAAAVAAAWGLVAALRRTMVRPLLRERDRTAAERDRLSGERDALIADRDQLLAERDGRMAQLQALSAQLQALSAERTALAAERDELTAERDELQGSVDATFVNLAMRTLTLVERQLVLIETLEGREGDPEQLDNLYRLDHLATRMRRNSENMLLLAGLENGRRGNRNVALLDVLRAAVSEIERYERVRIQFLPRVRLVGGAADDTSHLVAELLENATAFSPPQDVVEVGGWLLDNGELMISVVDHGIGIPAERLREINEQLDNPDPGDSAPLSGKAPWREQTASARSMGLFVVSRLARRHGVRVQLRETVTGGGVTAIVVVPREAMLEADLTAAELDEQRTAEREAAAVEPAAAPPEPAAPVRNPPLPRRGAAIPAPAAAGDDRPEQGRDDGRHSRGAEPAGETRPRDGGGTLAEPAAPSAPADPGGAARRTDGDLPEDGPVTRLGLPRRVPRGGGLPGTGEAPGSGLRRESARPAGSGESTGSTSAAELRRRLGGFQSGLRQAARESAQEAVVPEAVEQEAVERQEAPEHNAASRETAAREAASRETATKDTAEEQSPAVRPTRVRATGTGDAGESSRGIGGSSSEEASR
ncbi:sensor histidine kinase [Peterkaempfera griseoplana]|uniref:sensor histidine kinase n=1 Tax=Peterkaempfera griseoplana TaxID=66896 RepID=UPI0006E3AEE2|nr:ATP-binding protein [Peterkaempfera griseoplana]